MTILNFISQDVLDDLNEDPRTAFMELVNIAQRKLSEQSQKLEGEEQWNELEELRHSFMNVVVAAAKRYEIEPFASMQIPLIDNFSKSDHRQFKADLDHYVTQLMIDNSLQAKQNSVAILPNTKDSIRKYVLALRECIENSNMTASKKEALLKRLDAFGEELEKRRLSLMAVTRLTLELLALPGSMWASYDIAHKLITNVMQTVAEAQAAEMETRQIPPGTSLKVLSPPRVEPTPAPEEDSIPF
jgi:hypothetical protein